MSWLLLALALLLIRRAGHQIGRHRPDARSRRLGLAEVASLATLVACLMLGGRIAALLALPAAIGVFTVVRRLSRASKPPVDRQAVAFLLDLLAAVLRSGAPTDQAIEAVSLSVREHGGDRLRSAVEPLGVVGRLLRLGTEPEQAWTVLDQRPELAPVAAAGRRCAGSGARLAGALADTAEQLRAQQVQQAMARAQRAGVWALLPLGCCFLPAFVCIGVVPVVIGIAGQVLLR